jgi:dienelactone hydrolase
MASGRAYRSRAFRDVSYGRLEEAGGLADHVGAIRQLAEKHPYLDAHRVGIFGGSGGGYATVRAMLDYPEVFKDGVSYSGNHDQRLYIAEWGERYLGLPGEVDYSRQANSAFAERLAGKLLLVHGDMDDNVHPAHTLQLVGALITANKDFDLVILPNRAHDYPTDPYFNRRLWDYFVKHLLGLEPPAGYRIAPPGNLAAERPTRPRREYLSQPDTESLNDSIGRAPRGVWIEGAADHPRHFPHSTVREGSWQSLKES